MLKPTDHSVQATAWRDQLRPGDVVLFRFPCAEAKPAEKPKRRTCLVVETTERSNSRLVELAYGTSIEGGLNVGDEVHVTATDEMAAAGVRRPTRFVCARRIMVTVDYSGWDINRAHPSPIVGHLSEATKQRLNAIRCKISAHRAIAAEPQPIRKNDFKVEYRRRRTFARPRKAVRQ